eukprot:8730159-Pyramimonas_sp.AAC.1
MRWKRSGDTFEGGRRPFIRFACRMIRHGDDRTEEERGNTRQAPNPCPRAELVRPSRTVRLGFGVSSDHPMYASATTCSIGARATF